MCALQMHVEKTDEQPTANVTLTPAVASLLHSCVQSAQRVVKVMRVLGEQDLLGMRVLGCKAILSM